MKKNDADSLRELQRATSWKLQRIEDEEIVSDHTPPTPTQKLKKDERSSISLMFLGVFGGVYLLLTWGWIEIAKAYSIVNETQAVASGSVGFWLQLAVFWFAPLAPALWYLCSITLTQRLETAKLVIWLSIGLLILFPFPFFFNGGIF